MKISKNIISFVLALVMILTMIPQIPLTAEALSPNFQTGWIEWRPNPLYPDAPAPEQAASRREIIRPAFFDKEEYLELEQAAAVVREQIVSRTDVILVNLVLDMDDPRWENGDTLGLLLGEAFRHTGQPNEGDYQMLCYAGCTVGYGQFVSGNRVYLSMDMYMEYYTTAQQEQEMNAAVDQVMEDLALDGLSEYEKTKKIYEFVADHVSYDYENLYNYDYKLKLTAYAALINKTSVCQGYATLLYRLLLEAGVDCRCITGSAGGPHAWNIIRLGSLYYHADVTWDETATPQYYNYFLKGDRFNRDHTRDAAYLTEEFLQEYPMSSVDYDPSSVHSHVYVETVTPPTCVADGYTTYTCACGESYVGEHTDALDHNYVNGTCTLCGEEDPDYIPGNPFIDVNKSDYFFDPVLWAVEHGITAGTGAGKFSPNQTCTRGQVVTFLWRAAGCPEPENQNNPFADVPADAYYSDAVLWAVEQGITQGVGGGLFAPDREVTRAQFVTFLWRWAGSPALSEGDNPFADVSEGVYYYNAVLWAVENGVTAGTSATTFAPDNGCTRGQVVTFLYRYDQNSQGEEEDPSEPEEPTEPEPTEPEPTEPEPTQPNGLPEGVELLFHELWEPAVRMNLKELPAYNAEPTMENIMWLLNVCFPDGALMFSWPEEDSMAWVDPEGDLVQDLDTAIHETFHGFCHLQLRPLQAHYLGDGYYMAVSETDTYRSQEMTSYIPEELRTFRFDTYVGADSDGIGANESGIYGLLNEFNAYWMGMAYNVSMLDYFCVQEQSFDSWKNYFNGCENGVQAYAEFRYYILTYLLYARDHYPEIYGDLLDNNALRYAFTALDERYSASIAEYFDALERLGQGQIPGVVSMQVEDEWIMIGGWGTGRFTDVYHMLMEAMSAPEYQEILEAFQI